MDIAKAYFQSHGWGIEIAGKPYDLRCTSALETLYVEVKGTVTNGREVLLTPNEVDFARKHKDNMALFVVYEIQPSRVDGRVTLIGGKSLLIKPWDIDAGTLYPVGYTYSLPPREDSSASSKC